jgi:hypothetical protein
VWPSHLFSAASLARPPELQVFVKTAPKSRLIFV